MNIAEEKISEHSNGNYLKSNIEKIKDEQSITDLWDYNR